MSYDERLATRIRDEVANEPGITEKRMFGGLAFLVDGHMTVTASREGDLLLRVDPARVDALLAHDGARPAIMRGREMHGWLRVDATDIDDAELAGWVGEGVSYARSLPAK